MDEIYKNKAFFNGFSQDIQAVMKAVSFDNMHGLNLFGSMGLRSQQYASDYDLFQYVHTAESSNETALRKLATEFKFIVHSLTKMKDIYIGDIKAGSIEDWKVLSDKTYIDGNRVMNYNFFDASEKLESLKRQNIITADEYSTSKKLIVSNPTPQDYILMVKEIKFNVLRWKPKDISNGYLTLRNYKVVTLEEAFSQPAITKVDVVAYLRSNQYADVSIIYQFMNNKHVLNNEAVNAPIQKQEYGIKTDILYYMNTGFYFKVCKRIFTLMRMKGVCSDCMKVNSILNDSQLGILYTVYGDIGTILYILEETPELPIQRIENEVDQFKNKLSNIYKIPQYLDHEPEIFKIIDRITKAKHNREELITELTELSEILFTALNSYTLKLMKFSELYPIQRKFLP
jgi:hypothetical protein